MGKKKVVLEEEAYQRLLSLKKEHDLASLSKVISRLLDGRLKMEEQDRKKDT